MNFALKVQPGVGPLIFRRITSRRWEKNKMSREDFWGFSYELRLVVRSVWSLTTGQHHTVLFAKILSCHLISESILKHCSLSVQQSLPPRQHFGKKHIINVQYDLVLRNGVAHPLVRFPNPLRKWPNWHSWQLGNLTTHPHVMNCYGKEASMSQSQGIFMSSLAFPHTFFDRNIF